MTGVTIKDSFRIYQELGGKLDFDTYKTRVAEYVIALFSINPTLPDLALASGEGIVIGVASGVVKLDDSASHTTD